MKAAHSEDHEPQQDWVSSPQGKHSTDTGMLMRERKTGEEEPEKEWWKKRMQKMGVRKTYRGGNDNNNPSWISQQSEKQGPLTAFMSSSTDGFTNIYEPI